MTDSRIELFRQKMRADGLSEITIKNFEYYYEKLIEGDRGTLPSGDIRVLETLPHLDAIAAHSAQFPELLKKVCIIKLNGGLGTSMGLDRAKSLLPVIGELSFLDIIMRQVVQLRKAYGVQVPLLFMNSFRTEEDTLEVASAYPDLLESNCELPLSFVQNRVPKICARTFEPITWKEDPLLEWCPPGHGEIYPVLLESGVLEAALERGIQYAFISNADNLAAVLEPRILHYLIDTKAPFLMEVATRTISDRKGGHLASSAEDGRLLLRELAQCPEEDLEDFQDFKKYKYFNTNSLWVDLAVLLETLNARGSVAGLPLICNKKNVDPTKKDSPQVLQLETAMGAAISIFDDAKALHVGRDRFMPVKTTDQLLDLGSDNYSYDTKTSTMIPQRSDRMVIALDPSYYAHIKDFEERFPSGFPSLLRCSRLSVSGDVVFGSDVVCIGEVEVVNESGSQRILEDGTILEGRVVINS